MASSTSVTPLLPKQQSRKAVIVKAAWQLENAFLGKKVEQYPQEVQAARQLHYEALRFSKWYHGALIALVILTFMEVPTWCHENSVDKDIWTWYPGSEMCVVKQEGGEVDPFLSGVWYLPPGLALIIEIGIEIIVLRKFVLDFKLEQQHFAPLGVKFQNTRIIYWGCLFAFGSIIDTAIFTLFRLPIRFTFLFRTGLIFILPGVQSLFSSIFNAKMLSEFMSISVFLWGTMLFFAWVSVTIFGPLKEVAYKEEGEAVYVNKDLDTLQGAFYSMFVAAVTGEFVDVFLPTLTGYRSSGLLWFAFLILAKVLFENLTLDTLVSAYIRGAQEAREQAFETNAEGILAAFDTLMTLEPINPRARSLHGKPVLSKELFLELVNVFSRSPAMKFISEECATVMYDEVGTVTTDNFCEVCALLSSDLSIHTTDVPLKKTPLGRAICTAVTEPKEQPSFDNLMNNILLVNLALVLIESAYNLNDWGDPPAWTGYVELVFSFVYLGEVMVKVSVNTFDAYWLSFANRFDFFTTFLLLFSSLLPYLPNAVMPFDISHYANILRLLRLLRVVKQLKSMRSVQFLASTVTKMVSAAGNILLLLGCVVFFFTTLSVNLFGGVLYKGNPGLEHTEYEEKQWYVFNFNDTFMAFSLFFTQLLCEYVPTNAEALQKTSKWGDVAWLIFPCFYFIGVAIMFEILLAFTVEAYIELREESEEDEEEESESEEEEEEHHGTPPAHGHAGGEAKHGHGHEEEEFDSEKFFEEVQEKFEEKGLVVHTITRDEPNFPKLLKEAYEEVSEKKIKPGEIKDAAIHMHICKAAWQLENAIFHTEWPTYPENVVEARDCHFALLRANSLYYKAIACLVLLTFMEVPAWCHERSPGQDLWTWLPGSEWCHVPNHGGKESNPYLSGLWYCPPGIGLVAEMVIEIIVLRKFLLELHLEKTHFLPIGIKYYDHRLVYAGLFFAVGSVADTLFFTFARMPIRFTWVFRTGLLFILPGVQRVYTLIFNKRMIGEFASVAIFFVGVVLFFAWVTVTIFKDLNTVAFKLGEETVYANKGLGTLREATYSLFVSGIGEGFVDNFLPSYSAYRASGIFWLIFLVIGQILLLNLVIDAFVAAYLKGSEKEMDRKAEAQAKSMFDAFKTLSVGVGKGHPEVSKELFLEFVEDLGKSPRMYTIDKQTAEIIFKEFGHVTKEKFIDACRVVQNPVWSAKKDSCIATLFPDVWEGPMMEWLRNKVWEPKENPAFDRLMNQVLLANLILVVAQSAYNLNDWGEPPPFLGYLDIFFAFAYLVEVIVKLAVKSMGEYWSFVANQFDFFTTWLLLFTTLLPFLPFDFLQADLKHYANILRLFRLIRVVKQLKQYPSVQFMVATISRMINAAGDILQLLGVMLFFFGALSTNLWGGVLYEGKPELEDTDYAKKHWYIFNFNDMPMAFITFFTQLLSEYVPENAEALQVACTWGRLAWYIFPAFYILGVAIIFEIAKAFTIEYYLAIKEEADEEEEEEEEEITAAEMRKELEAQVALLDKMRDTLSESNKVMYYTLRNDSAKFQHELKEAYNECLEEAEKEAHGGKGHH